MNTQPLFSPTPPWIYVCPMTEEDQRLMPAYIYRKEGMNSVVRTLRGRKMRSVGSLMNEIGAAFQFFEGFGENWHALKECLSYLDEWMPADAYVVHVSSAQEVLTDERDEELHWLLTTLAEVGDFWSRPITDNERFARPGIPFHTVFKCPSQELMAVKTRFAKHIPAFGTCQ